jgi:hypothetical protein
MPPPRGRLPESVPTPTDAPEPMISACYIVRNAQDTLEESILSVAPHVSEIVVTDTGSTDQTLAILRRLMAADDRIRLRCFKWCDDFSQARNYCLSQATQDFILVIDADETLTAFRIEDGYEADWYPAVVTNHVASEGRRIPVRHTSTRLFRNFSGIVYQGIVHELVEASLAGRRRGNGSIQLEHSGYESEEMATRKARRNLELMKRQEVEQPANPANAFLLCKTHFQLEDYQACIDHGFQALLSPIDDHSKAQIGIFLHLAYAKLGKPRFGVRYLELALRFVPGQIRAHLLLIEYWQSIGRRDLIEKGLKELKNVVEKGASALANDEVMTLADLEAYTRRVQIGS